MKNLKFLLFATVFILASCEDLDVENTNNPSTEQVLATTDDYVSVLDGAAYQWWTSLHKYDPYMTLLVAADFGSSSWGNFNMRNVGTVGAPYGLGDHSALENTVTASETDYLEVPYNGMYAVISSANDVIVNAQTIENASQKNDLLSYAYMLRGMAYGYLGLLFDKALVYDENTEGLTDKKFDDFVGYEAVLTQAQVDLNSAIGLFDSTSASFSISGFNGLTVDADAAKSLCHAYAAKFLVHGARNSAETAAVDWNKVKEHATAASSPNLSPIGDGGTLWWHAYYLMNNDGWIRLDQKVVNMANSNAPYPFPEAGAYTPSLPDDLRFGETDEKFIFAGAAPFRPDRGVYFYSYWQFNEYQAYRSTLDTPMPSFQSVENSLNLAEAHIRLGIPGAAAIINATRVTNGGLDAATDSDTDLLDKLMYERYIEAYEGPGNPFFDRRRSDDLGSKQFTHLPVPKSNLDSWGAPGYTTGG